MAFPTARLYLLFTPAHCARDPWGTLEGALQGGVDLVQYRVKEPDPAGIARCIHICRPYDVPVLVNDHVDLAVALDADGAHVGQDDMDAATARSRLGARWLGVSTHDEAQVAAAHAAGADYIGFGPCFPTATKGYTEGRPRDAVRRATDAAARAGLPLFGLGGVRRDRVALLAELGVRRLAVSAAILHAERPRDAAAGILEVLDRVT